MHPRHRGSRGVTLVEAMVALAILAVGLAGFSTSMVASAGQDRRNNARAYAQTLADEMARTISHWKFDDPRLAYTVQYLGTDFSKPTIDPNFTVTPASPMPNPTVPASVTETLNPAPNYGDGSLTLGTGWGSRTLAQLNLEEPGRTYVFNRYWNVTEDPANPALKLIAVHVTYSDATTHRGLVSAFTSVNNEAVLGDLLIQ